MDPLHGGQQSVGALDDMAVALDADEQADLVGRSLHGVIFERLNIDGKPCIGHLIAHEGLVSRIVLIEARHNTVDACENVVAVLAHEGLFPVILLLRDILAGADIGRRLVTQAVIAVTEGVPVMAGVIIDHVGRQCRKDHMPVIRLEIVEHLGNAMRLESQENG